MMGDLLSKILEMKNDKFRKIISIALVLLILLYSIKIFFRDMYIDFLSALTVYSKKLKNNEWHSFIEVAYTMVAMATIFLFLMYLFLQPLHGNLWSNAKSSKVLRPIRSQFVVGIGNLLLSISTLHIVIVGFFELLKVNYSIVIPAFTASLLTTLYLIMWAVAFVVDNSEDSWGWIDKT